MSKRRSTKKLTPSLLRRLVLQERRRMVETSDPVASGVEDPAKVSAEEVDAEDLAGSLEKDLDHLKALKVKESKLRRELSKVHEARKRLGRRLLKAL
tara:strand:+ start:152 stop:442 length:291 start_codon:yes stop_codon:yes gene_type:complete